VKKYSHFTDVQFLRNSALTSGATLILSAESNYNIQDSIFSSNRVILSGGAIFYQAFISLGVVIFPPFFSSQN
jgi:hypothetical protein